MQPNEYPSHEILLRGEANASRGCSAVALGTAHTLGAPRLWLWPPCLNSWLYRRLGKTSVLKHPLRQVVEQRAVAVCGCQGSYGDRRQVVASNSRGGIFQYPAIGIAQYPLSSISQSGATDLKWSVRHKKLTMGVDTRNRIHLESATNPVSCGYGTLRLSRSPTAALRCGTGERPARSRLVHRWLVIPRRT